MKKIIPSLFMLPAMLLLATIKITAQTPVYNQNFDASITDLPAGWNATPNGWVVDTSNSSLEQYTGASGNSNIVVKNSSPTGTYELVTGNISTLNFKDIKVLWAARLTKNFTSPGSSVTGFYMTTNDGSSWDNISYTENPTGSSSPWLVDNNGTAITLPASANNKAAVKFKWIVDIVNNSQGTYRIDDFNVTGTPVSTGISTIEGQNLAKVFTSNSNIQIIETGEEALQVEVFNILGESVKTAIITSPTFSIPASGLLNGIYLVRVSTRTASSLTKIVLNK